LSFHTPIRTTKRSPAVIGADGVTVTATNAVGTGPASAASNSVTPVSCPCNIWSASTSPSVASWNDPSAVELGVKFRSDTPGYVTGIRFYKGTGNTGTHVGSLWTSSGTKLAGATFSGETATGWQQVNFATPVQITANTTYVASYYAPNAGYAATGAQFATAGVDNPPLHALANGVDGGDGVYAYGTSGFPANSYNATNYWVDIAFTATG
jgi:hypothetical protein